MSEEHNMERFIRAQQTDYATALTEIKRGRKRSHWMWYVFPQIQGLGFTETSRYYAIKSTGEASAYLKHPVLGSRLVEICNALLTLESNDPGKILGSPDDLKLKSSMTLFAALPDTNPVFGQVLNKFYRGAKDDRTLAIIGQA